jgi:hypothetical protein
MTLNPLQRRLLRRKTDKIFADNGWGPQLSWPVPRAEGKPLVFQMRLPAGMQLIDVAELANGAQGAPGSLARTTAALTTGAEAAGAIVVAAICPVVEAGQTPDVVATVTVALSDLPDLPAPHEGLTEDSDDSTRGRTEVEVLSDGVTRVERLSVESRGDGHDPVPMLVVQYLIKTRYGAISMAFTTTRDGMFSERGRWLFREVMKSGFIGEQPKAF